MHETQTDRLLKDPKNMRLFQQERLILEATSHICEVMDEKQIGKSQLATLLTTSRGYISQLLGGEQNMTLRKLSDVFFVLGLTVHIQTKALHAYAETPTLHITEDVEWPRQKNGWPAAPHSIAVNIDEEEALVA